MSSVEQLDIFAQPQIGKFRADAEPTSRKAAISVYLRSGTQRHRLLVEIERAGASGLTCDDVEAITGLPHQSASPRWNELWHDFEMIEPTDRERATRNGSQAAVFVITERGREALRAVAE